MQPDVLWLSLESVRADHTSVYGYERETTPRLKAFCDRTDATVLDPGIAASMWTPASTASMLTGTHMSTHQVGKDGTGTSKLPGAVETLPGRLQRAGYRTALFSTNPYISTETGLTRGFEYETPVWLRRSNYLRLDAVLRDKLKSVLRVLAQDPVGEARRLRSTVEHSGNFHLVEHATRWFTRRYGGEDPFFVYAHIPSPHHPYKPVGRFREAFVEARREVGPGAAESLVDRVYDGLESLKEHVAGGLPLSEAELEAIRSLYDAEVRCADHAAGELIEAAQAASSRPLRTVVVGDHGELFGERGLLGHNLVLDDAVTRVPMVLAGFDGIKDDANTLSQHVDLTRTVAAETGVSERGMEGRNLRTPDRPHAVSQRGVADLDAYRKYDDAFDASRFFSDPVTAVRDTEFRFLSDGTRSVLYSLSDEGTDVADRYPGASDRLSGVVDALGVDWGSGYDQAAAEFDEQARERLRDMGYLPGQ